MAGGGELRTLLGEALEMALETASVCRVDKTRLYRSGGITPSTVR